MRGEIGEDHTEIRASADAKGKPAGGWPNSPRNPVHKVAGETQPQPKKNVGNDSREPRGYFFPLLEGARETIRRGCGDYRAHRPGAGIPQVRRIRRRPAFAFHYANYAVHGAKGGVSGKAIPR